MLRYGISLLIALTALAPLWGTLAANVLGCLLIGMVVGSVSAQAPLLLLSVGLCGGFTTFSTFSLQSLGLLQSGRPGQALLYIAATVAICLLATWLGTLIVAR